MERRYFQIEDPKTGKSLWNYNNWKKGSVAEQSLNFLVNTKGNYSVQLLSRVWLFATPWTATRQGPCPSPTPGTCSNSCPSSWWCHPTISSSGVPFSYLQSFPASGSFPVSQFFPSGSQSIKTSVLPMSIQDWFPLGWTGWISLQSKGLTSLQHHSSKASILWCSAFFIVQLSLSYMTTGKTTALTRRTFVGKVTSLLLNMLSRLVIAFLPRSKRITWTTT